MATELVATGERPVSKAREEIIREAKRLEERTRDSSKGHHCAAEGWMGRHLWLGVPTVILSTIVGATTFSEFSKQYSWIGVVSGVISMIIAVLSGINTFLNPNDRGNSHLTAAHAYDKLNNEARVFSTIDCWREESSEILTAKLRELIATKDNLNSDSPQIPPWAWKRAKKRIAEGETSFEVDKPHPP